MKKPHKPHLYLVKAKEPAQALKKEINPIVNEESINTFDAETILRFILARENRLSVDQKMWFDRIADYLLEHGCLTQAQQNMLFSFYISLGGFKIQLTMLGNPLLKIDSK